jgi:hypothetical protein
MNHAQIQTQPGHRSGSMVRHANRVSAIPRLCVVVADSSETVVRSVLSTRREQQRKWGLVLHAVTHAAAGLEQHVHSARSARRTGRRKPTGCHSARKPAEVQPVRRDVVADGLRLRQARRASWLLHDAGVDAWQTGGTADGRITRNLESSAEKRATKSAPQKRKQLSRCGTTEASYAPAAGQPNVIARELSTRCGSITPVFEQFSCPAAGHLSRFTICSAFKAGDEA